MIVQESDLLLAALDRRLQVDRTLPLDVVGAVAGSAADDGGAEARVATGPASTFATIALDPESLAARIPLGEVVDARVVATTDDLRVVADVDRWRFAMAWPTTSGGMPRVGDDLRLLVLAHRPNVVFQHLDEASDPAAARAPMPVRWSREALALARTVGDTPAASGERPDAIRHFTAPMLRTGTEASPAAETSVTTPTPRSPTNAGEAPVVAAPVVLHGPAWTGQPLDLVVRRDRADPELDNPVLDQWCGEITIDLPNLGRVAGHLALSMSGLRVRLEADDGAAVDLMTSSSSELAAAFGEHDFRLQALAIGCRFPHTGAGGDA